MKKKIDTVTSVLENYRKKLKNIDRNEKISKIVKEIDKLTQQLYYELYQLRDGENKTVCRENPKKSHCC